MFLHSSSCARICNKTAQSYDIQGGVQQKKLCSGSVHEPGNQLGGYMHYLALVGAGLLILRQ